RSYEYSLPPAVNRMEKQERHVSIGSRWAWMMRALGSARWMRPAKRKLVARWLMQYRSVCALMCIRVRGHDSTRTPTHSRDWIYSATNRNAALHPVAKINLVLIRSSVTCDIPKINSERRWPGPGIC